MADVARLRVPEEAAGERLDRFLAGLPEIGSRAVAERLLRDGGVLVDGAPRAKSARLAGGEELEFEAPGPVTSTLVPEEMELTVPYEDEHLLVVDKPAGMVVHPAAGNPDGTLVNALLHHCAGRLSGIGGVARPGIVHRIDKDTSGLLVVAKTDVAHEGLAAQFAKHSIDRRYQAIVAGLPNPLEGSIDAPLARSSANRQKMAIVEGERGKRAVTHYRTLRPLRESALAECRLETGRTHQVRVHMASIGHPLLGDPVYGRSRLALRELLKRLNFERQALHAAELGFIHPVTRAHLSFKSAVPSDMQELLSALSL